MSQPGQSNSIWISRVRSMLKDGFGAEDIAIALKCDAADVRREVAILRDAGVFEKWWGKKT